MFGGNSFVRNKLFIPKIGKLNRKVLGKADDNFYNASSCNSPPDGRLPTTRLLTSTSLQRNTNGAPRASTGSAVEKRSNVARGESDLDEGGQKLGFDFNTHLAGGSGDDLDCGGFSARIEILHFTLSDFRDLLFSQFADLGLVRFLGTRSNA